VTGAWDTILKGLRPRAKGLFTSGRLVGVEENRVVYAFPSATVCEMAEVQMSELEAALAAHFGGAVAVRLVVDGGGDAPAVAAVAPDEELPDLTGLTDAPEAPIATPVDHLTSAFPGAEIVDEGDR